MKFDTSTIVTNTDIGTISTCFTVDDVGCEKGAHKLTNNSLNETLVYLDFDTCNSIDVAFYPYSGKIGVWGMNINKLYKVGENVDYYDGE